MRRLVPIGLFGMLMPAPAFANYELLVDLIALGLLFVGVLVLVWVLAIAALILHLTKNAAGARGVGLVAFILGLLPGLLFLAPPVINVASGEASDVTPQFFALAAAFLGAAFIGWRMWRTKPAPASAPVEQPAE